MMSTLIPAKLLRDLSERIEVAMGLYFPPDRLSDLERKIRLAARDLAFLDLEAFTRQLLSSPLANDQVRMLAGYLTIGETYFYREPQVWKFLKNEILPSLIASRTGNTQSLRFWSAACSTGEEPYTLAMTLTEVLPRRHDWQTFLLATDLNPHALRRAQAGVYGAWSFRVTAPEVRARFFHPRENKQFAILPEIQQMVTFVEANLISPVPITNSGMMDVIFCRNVLFYFTPERARRVLERCYDSLVDGGWLIVSPVETTYVSELPFVPVSSGESLVYRKDGRQVRHPSTGVMPPPSLSLPQSVLSTPVVVWPKPRPDDEVTRSHPSPLEVEAANLTPAPEPYASASPGGGPSTTTLFEQVCALYEQGQYEQVTARLLPWCQSTDTVTPPTLWDSPTLILLIRAYANQGHLIEAQSWCEKALTNDRFNSGLHYLLATILLEQERIPDATRALHKAIYIDPNFVLAHFALGNLFFQQQRHVEAKRHLSQALAILRQAPRDEIVPESEGLTAGRLADLVHLMLQR